MDQETKQKIHETVAKVITKKLGITPSEMPHYHLTVDVVVDILSDVLTVLGEEGWKITPDATKSAP